MFVLVDRTGRSTQTREALMSANWDDSMETGDPTIDRQHREIIELVDRLDARSGSTMTAG